MPSVHQSNAFLRHCKAEGVDDDEREAIALSLGLDPTQGIVIRGSGGVRKTRFAGRGKGKSGGYRVAFYYRAEGSGDVFVLALFGKGTKANFTDAEVKALKKAVDALKEIR